MVQHNYLYNKFTIQPIYVYKQFTHTTNVHTQPFHPTYITCIPFIPIHFTYKPIKRSVRFTERHFACKVIHAPLSVIERPVFKRRMT